MVEVWEPLETLGGGGVPKTIVAWEYLPAGLWDLFFILNFFLRSPFRSCFLACWDLQMPRPRNCKPRLQCCISACNWEPTQQWAAIWDTRNPTFNRQHSLATIPFELQRPRFAPQRPSFAPFCILSALTATPDLYEEYSLEAGINFLF